MGIDKETARRQASKRFGEVFFWWYAAPVVAGKVLKAIAVLGAIAGVVVGGIYVYSHVGEWVTWLGYMGAHYLLPMMLVALSVVVYAVSVVVVWRLNSWRWKFNGLSTARYTLLTSCLFIICITLVGVTIT